MEVHINDNGKWKFLGKAVIFEDLTPFVLSKAFVCTPIEATCEFTPGPEWPNVMQSLNALAAGFQPFRWSHNDGMLPDVTAWRSPAGGLYKLVGDMAVLMTDDELADFLLNYRVVEQSNP